MKVKDLFHSCFSLKTGALIVGYIGVIQCIVFVLLAAIGFLCSSAVLSLDIEEGVHYLVDLLRGNETALNATTATDAESKLNDDEAIMMITILIRRVITIGVYGSSITLIFFSKNLVTYVSLLIGVYKKNLYAVKKWIIYNLIYLGLQTIMNISTCIITSLHPMDEAEIYEFIVTFTLLVWNVGGWVMVLSYYWFEKKKNDVCSRGQQLGEPRLVLADSDDESCQRDEQFGADTRQRNERFGFDSRHRNEQFDVASRPTEGQFEFEKRKKKNDVQLRVQERSEPPLVILADSDDDSRQRDEFEYFKYH